MKTIFVLLLFILVSCSENTEKKVDEPKNSQSTEKTNKHNLLKGHQDTLNRAKEMEKEVLKAAEKQKKAIDELDE